MCGIVGIYAYTMVGKMYFIRLAGAVQIQTHRGKDSSNTFSDHRIGLGHTRLAVIDRYHRSSQPMHDANQKFTIVYNGEVYNHLALRKELCEQGERFQTESDTESVLLSYKHQRENAFAQFNGFFALGIYEHETQALCIARDVRGIKPLYYYRDDDKFLFASELRALMAFNIPKEINQTALDFYFRLNYISCSPYYF